MVQKFKVGTQVVIEGSSIIEDGTTGTVVECAWSISSEMVCVAWDVPTLKHLGHSHAEPNWYCVNVKYLTKYVEPVELDLHVYPDTPVGTELIVTQDTITLYGNEVPKGTIVTLAKSEYCGKGAYRVTKDAYGLGKYIDCDHLMIKG